MWFVLGVLALVFLCILACGAAAAVFAPRSGGVWVQAPSGAADGQAGAVPPATAYHTYGAWGPLGIVGAGLGLLFKLFLFGLLALLLLGLVRRVLWGHRRMCPPYWYGAWRTAPQGGPQGEGEAPDAGAGWGPPPWKRHAWRYHHHHPWGPPPWWGPQPPQPPEQAPERGTGEGEPGAPDGEYTGPME
jgi:hypothetical protein